MGRLIVTAVVLLSQAFPAAAQEKAVDIGSRRELFVDGFLVEKLDRARLVLHEPQPLRTTCLQLFLDRVVLFRRQMSVLMRQDAPLSIKRLLQGATSLTLIEALHRCLLNLGLLVNHS